MASCLRRCYPLVRKGGVVLIEEYYKHEGSRLAADEALRGGLGGGGGGGGGGGAATVEGGTYAVGEHTRPRFGFSQKHGPPPGQPLSFGEVGRAQVLAPNVTSEAHPLLQRSDKCCHPERMDPARCCRPHAILWQRP